MSSLYEISILRLSLVFLPAFLVVYLLFCWELEWKNALYAIVRMLAQLLLVGYLLVYVFASDSALVVLLIMLVMVAAASWIGLRTVEEDRAKLYLRSLLSISVGGGATFFLVTQGVLELEPWYTARYSIPLAGMIFANAMNSVSLAAERYSAELANGRTSTEARATAYRAGLIPITNSLFAVGLVSLPGMMTGQILSGVSPLIAVRYQIMVMCMVFGAAGISTAMFLALSSEQPQRHTDSPFA